MADITYGEIRDTFKSRLNRRDCTDALADGFISDALKRIQRVIRIPLAEQSLQFTISADNYLTDGELLIPEDYLGVKDITHTNSAGKRTVLRRKSLDFVQHCVDWGAQGTTKFYTRQGAAWVFGPKPLAGDVIRVDYYAEYASLSASTDTAPLLTIADDLIVYGALSYAATHWRDKRAPEFESRFTQIISDIQQQADMDELAGDAAVDQAFIYPSDE